MKDFSQIKFDFLNGNINFEQTKKDLFECSPHVDAIESNNELLKLWSKELEKDCEEESYSNRAYAKTEYERKRLNDELTAAQAYYHSR